MTAENSSSTFSDAIETNKHTMHLKAHQTLPGIRTRMEGARNFSTVSVAIHQAERERGKPTFEWPDRGVA